MVVDRDTALANIVLSKASAAPIADRYSDLSLLSKEGYTSLVFSARDLRSTGNRFVVLKFLKPWADAYRTACFRREVEATKDLIGRENVVQLTGGLDVLPIDLVHELTGLPISMPCQYFALERARSSFSDLLFGHARPRSLVRRLSVIRDILKGVQRLHSAGYCHRDLKPDNVLLFGKGTAKLGDLGTCRKLSGADPLLGNYSVPPGDCTYAAPETFNGAANISSLYCGTDWFSVGAILFEAVSGQNLYVAIGLRGPQEIVNALAVGRSLDEYRHRVSHISGRYPIPSTLDFAGEPWFARTSEATHAMLSSLVRDLCHFDYGRRLSDFPTALRRLDLIIASTRLDERYGGRANTAGVLGE